MVNRVIYGAIDERELLRERADAQAAPEASDFAVSSGWVGDRPYFFFIYFRYLEALTGRALHKRV